MINELGDNLIPVLAISLTFSFFAIWVIAATLDSMYKATLNARLKERLVDRGASANEIAQIITAGTDDYVQPDPGTPKPPRKSYAATAGG